MSVKSNKVVVTGVGGNVGQGVIKSLRSGRMDFCIIGIDLEPLSAGFALSDKSIVVPRTGSREFTVALEEILSSEKPDAIYVCSPMELEYFSRNKDRLEKKYKCAVLVNTRYVVKTGSDKLLTQECLKEKGFPFLPSASADDSSGIRKVVGESGFPLVVKPRKGFSSKNVFIVHDKTEMMTALNFCQDMMVQKYIHADEFEYTSGTLSSRSGKAKACITLRRNLIQGTTYRTELVRDPDLDEQVCAIVDALGSVGPCNLQYRMKDNKLYVFEINPRFSGTTGIRYLYGYNDAELAFEMFCLGKEIKQPVLNDAVVLRYWNEIVIKDAVFSDIQSGKMKLHGRQVYVTCKKQ